MYLSISIENIMTIGVMLLCWMLLLHILAQFGLKFASWLPGGS